MRRFSQRNFLVTLSDINITPLLDLAFVLLIIFVITTPLLTQTIDLKLPDGGRTEKKPQNPRDVRTVEISREGTYRLDGKTLAPKRIEEELVRTSGANPNLIVDIRGDENCPYKLIATILDCCQRHHLRMSLRTAPSKKR